MVKFDWFGFGFVFCVGSLLGALVPLAGFVLGVFALVLAVRLFKKA